MQPIVTNNIQAAFLEQIRNRIPENVAFADELAELLNISRDSAYRRIRGETVLSLDEVKKLYDRYGVSIDSILSPSSNMALFHHRALTHEYSLDRWMNSVSKNLELVSTFHSKEMIYAAKDIPIFHYFRFRELSAFKMFFWLKTVMRDPGYVGQNFHCKSIPNDLLAAGKRIWDLYAQVPSTELWGDEVINETIKQIQFYKECGFFSEADMPLQICQQLQALNQTVKQEATEGFKTEGASYRLYENEILIADNTVFAKMGEKRVVYINYNTLNLLTTLQESFCEKTEQYLNNLMKNSTLISTTSEKERNKFFNKLKDRIELFEASLK